MPTDQKPTGLNPGSRLCDQPMPPIPSTIPSAAYDQAGAVIVCVLHRRAADFQAA
ncbi:uncharacterized protein METZ01_LOCUS183784 [marine metagenome]|uniref:Uncharacterized protein n=1 Tax=marine metagenome TaxID=408172 RepID=A0A382CXM7_9ZZZZ